MRLIALFCVGLFSLSAESQDAFTWGNLRFGMTPDEVKTVFNSRLQPTGSSRSGDMAYAVSGVTVGRAQGTARLRFDPQTQTLRGITLDFGLNTGSCKATPEVTMQRYWSILDVSDALIRKYGVPTDLMNWPVETKFLEDLRQETQNPIVSRKWVLPAQTINSAVVASCNSFRLTVSYFPAAIAPEI